MLLHHSCLQQRNLLLTRLTAFAFEVWRSSARLLAITHALPCLHSLQRNPFVCGFVRDCAFGNICTGDAEGDSTVTKRIRLQKRRLRHFPCCAAHAHKRAEPGQLPPSSVLQKIRHPAKLAHASVQRNQGAAGNLGDR